MGQTLPNGIYLPAEGERNCYDGLEGNWRSLDGLISTVAGKASATHTHGNITNDGKVGTTANLPLITGTGGAVQAGSFGNQANTFCEGNDSRLSDARTPVAHTHGKADITDLLNSNFIPSANNSYDLGSSSYQWNNLYAKNYFYNGTAWGLDQANVWSAWQTIEKTNSESLLRLRRTDIKIGDSIPANQINVGSLGFAGSDDFNLGLITCRDETNGNTRLVLATRQKYDSNGDRSNNGTVYESRVDIGITSSRALYLRPYVDNLVNLGTSTNKWKSLNGINPGALSLPSENASSVNLDPTNWVTDGSNYNSYTPPSDGWLAIQVHSADITDLTGQYVFAGRATGGSDYWAQGGLGVLKMVDGHNAKLIGQIFIPVISGKNYHITIKINKTQTEGSIIYARFYPCQGNV